MAPYDAFISYSHAKDKPIASALQSAIQKLGKPWYRRRAMRLFRDDTSLSATPHLWPTIEHALGQSSHFLVLASPEAAASKWVNKEVDYWIENNSINTLLIGLTDGELTWDDAAGDFVVRDDKSNPLPPALAKKFLNEPKWVDLRAYRDGADKSDAKFTELAADFAAAIRGIPKDDLLSQEVRQQRRALTLAWGAASALLVLAVAATGAGILAFRAEQRATRTLAEATDTANKLVVGLAARFKTSIGMPASLVKEILDRAQALQQQLIKSGQVTPDLKRSEAAALLEVAESLLTIGDTKGSVAAGQQALEIFSGLLADDTDNREYQRGISSSYELIGYAQLTQGKLADALTSYQADLALAQWVTKSTPADVRWQGLLSEAYSRVGDVQRAQGNLGDALTSYQMSFTIVEALAKSSPDNKGLQDDLASMYDRMGNIQDAQGKLAAALVSYESQLAILERLTQSDPGNAQAQADLSVAYEKVGFIQSKQGKRAEALATVQTEFAIVERLAKSDPDNTRWQAQLAAAYEHVGRAQATLGKLGDALASHQAELAISERLAKSDADNTRWQIGLALAYEDLGNVHSAQSQLDDALASYQAELAIVDHLARSEPRNVEAQRTLSVTYAKMGDVRVKQNDLGEALKSYRSSLAIRRQIALLDRSSSQGQKDLINSLGDVSYVLIQRSDFADALEAADEAISLAPDQAWLHLNRAHALMFLGRTDEAREVYVKYRGQKVDGKLWQAAVLDDFAQLRKIGLTNPLMAEIEKLFNSAG